ncbi:MAG: hypothetical protein EXR72_11255 [Myxococcales bacterium]|nr:hypothetical protein [Myxococcales bacterium]
MKKALVAVSLALLGGGTAAADWPMFGHDPGRTALATGTSQISKPVTRWRRYLGGTIGPGGLRAFDLDHDGSSELLIVTGGRVVARHENDSKVWESPLIEAAELVDVRDFDGDGQIDLLVRSIDRVFLLAGRSGAIEWESFDWNGARYPLGTIGAVRVADLDGDGFPDIYVPAGFCGSGGNDDDRGSVAFTFRGGGATLAKPRRLFETRATTPEVRCGFFDILADLDGDGRIDLVSFGRSRVHVFSTVDGSLKFSSDELGAFPWQVPVADVADLDGDGRNEIVLFLDNPASPGVHGRRVIVAGWKSVAGKLVFAKWWEHAAGDPAVDRHGFADDSLADVDGDGKLEITTSFYSATTKRWSLVVYDARTGIEELRREGAGELVGLIRLGAGTASPPGSPGMENIGILTSGVAGLTAFTIVDGSLNQLWTFAHTRAVLLPDPGIALLRSSADRVLIADACGSSVPELILLELDAAERPATLAAYQTGQNVGGARCRGAYDVRPDGETLLALFSLDGGARLAAARSSGFLTTLARRDGLVPENLDTGAFPDRGVKLGGFYSGPIGRGRIPIAPSLGGEIGTPVIVPDSRGFLHALDVNAATLVTAARVLWALPDVTQPSAIDVLGGPTPEIVGWRGNALTVLDAATGQEVRRFQVAPAESRLHVPHFDVLGADLTGDGRSDLIYQVINFVANVTETRALNAQTGAPAWAKGLDFPPACGTDSTSLADLDGDGVLDVVSGACSGLVALNGRTGNVLPGHLVNANFAYLAIAADTDGDGKPELLSSGQLGTPHAFRTDFTPLWTNTDLGTPASLFHFAAVARCGAKLHYAGTEERQPRLFVLDAVTGKTLNGSAGSPGVVLAEGAVFATAAAARAAGKRPGRLGNVTATQSLRAPGTPAFLVGSTDGWLYTIDACTGALIWTLDLHAAVGQPILADVRGSGQDQIVVTAADGYAYGIDQEVFPAPAWARDVDPVHGRPDEQVEIIETSDALYLAWAAVPGALRYECAVMTASGTVITNPEFVDCGTGTHATIGGLPLRAGGAYQQAVRAIGPAGASIETLTRGVRVKGIQDPGGEQINPPLSDHGCDCTVGGPPSRMPWAALALLALAAWGARRRTRG